jgi:hypothetical protein
MADDRAVRRSKMRKKLTELKDAAIAELERRGYDVRGKTPAQIRQILNRRPKKRISNAESEHQEPSRREAEFDDVLPAPFREVT